MARQFTNNSFFLFVPINVFYFVMKTWQEPGRPVLLASQSPRRKQILTQMGVTFTTATPQPVDEASFINTADLEQSLRDLATAKAADVADRHPQALVLGADTIVVKNRRVLGKPKDADEAAGMLAFLSGGRHQVMTGISLICRQRSFSTSAVAVTDVFFRKIGKEEIDRYLTDPEYADKAGAYAIQGKALVFVSGINGCFYNVVGLPVTKTITLFTEFISVTGNV